MKMKKPYRPRQSQSAKLLKECAEAMTEAIDCWETPDSPEAFCYAMKHLMILRDRIIAMQGNKP